LHLGETKRGAFGETGRVETSLGATKREGVRGDKKRSVREEERSERQKGAFGLTKWRLGLTKWGSRWKAHGNEQSLKFN